jgi:hypothetical protein
MLYSPSSSSGRTHHRHTATVEPTHHTTSLTCSRVHWRVTSHRPGSTSAISTIAPLTPPMPSTASADSPAARRGDPSRLALTSGNSTHGSSAAGSISAESGPISVSMRGASAYPMAPANLAGSEPMLSARASSSMPPNARHSTTAHQSRCVTHGGRPSSWPAAKNGPIGNR